jgi:DNA-binding NarL/FixJ family response regulator
VNEYRVVIASSDPMLRTLLVAQVEQVGHRVVGEAESAQVLLDLAQREQADAVVLHWLSMDADDGDGLLAQLRDACPSLRLVALVEEQQPRARYAALAAGAWACIAAPPGTVEVMAAFEAARPAAPGARAEEQAPPHRDGVSGPDKPAPIPVVASASRSAEMNFLKRAV